MSRFRAGAAITMLAWAIASPLAHGQTPRTQNPFPTADELQHIVEQGSVIVPPVQRRYGLELEYPDEARARGHQGVTTVTFCVDEIGRILNVKLTESSGSPWLDEAAILQLPKGRFTPGRVNGVNTAMCGVSFKLDWAAVG